MSRAQLDAEVLAPWIAGREITMDEHEYSPRRARLTVFEARELAVSELGLGRGWQLVQKEGDDVTERVLDETRGTGVPAAGASSRAGLQEFKAAVLGACSLEPRALADLVRLAAVRHHGARASDCLALAEAALWELLHEQKLSIHEHDDATPVPPERWEALVLAWESWSGEAPLSVRAL